jgi:hypothetical protein
LKSLEKGADKDIDLLFRDVKKLMPRDQVSWTNSSLEKEFSLSLVVLKKEGSEMKREASPGEALNEAVVRVAEGKAAGDVYENGFGMRFRWCPAGEFLMGSSKAEQEMVKKWDVDASNGVQHRVRLTSG